MVHIIEFVHQDKVDFRQQVVVSTKWFFLLTTFCLTTDNFSLYTIDNVCKGEELMALI